MQVRCTSLCLLTGSLIQTKNWAPNKHRERPKQKKGRRPAPVEIERGASSAQKGRTRCQCGEVVGEMGANRLWNHVKNSRKD